MLLVLALVLALVLIATWPGQALAYSVTVPETWRSCAGDDPAWALPSFDDSSWQEVNLLGTWQEQGYQGIDGMIWYRQQVVLEGEARDAARAGELGLLVGETSFGGYQVYAGGLLIGESVGWSMALPKPTRQVYTIPAAAVRDDHRLDLALRLHRVGWLSDSYESRSPSPSPVGGELAISSYTALNNKALLTEKSGLLHDVPLLLFAALFGAMVCYQLLLFLRRRQEIEHLWFAMFTACFSIYTLVISDWFWLLTKSYATALRVSDSMGHAAAASAIQFLWSFFNRPVGKLLRAYQISQITLVVLTVLWPEFSRNEVCETVRLAWLLPLLIAAGGLIIVRSWRGDMEARTIAAGGIALVGIEIWQIARLFFGLSWNSPIALPPVGFAAITICISFSLSNRFRRVHEELDQLRVSLEEKVKERTMALTVAKEEAEAASRVKSQFLANMSHEIRTPMTAVIGMTDLLLTQKLIPRHKSYVETIRLSGETLLALINDLLDFSKIESGKVEIDCSPVDLRSVVKDSLDLVKPMAEEKGLVLAGQIADDVPELLNGDGARTRQILLNLLANAVKFTPAGAIRVSVSGYLLEDNRYEARFSVIDTGIGIPTEELDNLFDPFHQVDGSLTRTQRGTGLGLAISRRLTELLGGEIWVESTVGEGSTFSFTIVADVVTAPVRAHSRLPVASVAEERAGNRGHRVLLAEDNEVSRAVIEQLLAGLGYEVDSVENGRQVVAAVAKQRYDVILMDVQMPEMSGLDATRQIRKNKLLQPAPRIIALTGHVMLEDRKLCLEAGMDDYLSKPVQVDQLKAALSRAITG